MSQQSYLIVALLIWNLIVFFLYGYDKQRAIKKQWRISERTLLSVTFLLGGLGAMLGGKVYHHKTKKWYFNVSWCIGICLLVCVVYWLVR